MKFWQKALLKIDRAFAEAGVFYALGGSAMLCLRGLETSAHDLDLFVRFEDKDKAQTLLCSIGEQIAAPTKPEYETKHYSKYLVEEIEVDLMADFAVMTKEGLAGYPSRILSAMPVVQASRTIPCMRLEDWLYLYLAIGRTHRVQTLEKYFASHAIDRDRIVTLASLQMPEGLRAKLLTFLNHTS